MIDCIKDRSRLNKIINLGGPDEPLTKKSQGEMLYNAVGKKPNFFYAPLWLFDTIIDSLQWVADTFKSEQFENAAELGRIGKYYAVEDMLTTDPSEKFGTMTLQEHYNKIAVEGQEYDPYTSIVKLLTNAILKNNTFVFIPMDATV
jgi:divinyl chlorophyllide a 8-vinyl-reductase